MLREGRLRNVASLDVASESGRVANSGVELASLMKRTDLKRQLLFDTAVAAVLVCFVLIVSPGLAVVGMLALLVSVVAGAGFVIELPRARRRPKGNSPRGTVVSRR